MELVAITKPKQNVESRQKCIESKGIKCIVCGFDFEATYGSLGKGFIDIHYVNPVATKNGSPIVDYEKDLVPICPNCHAMLHRIENDPLSIEELQHIICSRKMAKGRTFRYNWRLFKAMPR